ncbi:hypothetical protein [Actinomadura hibisca]|nr:hypothetical protein [Actinomadura hibisca]
MVVSPVATEAARAARRRGVGIRRRPAAILGDAASAAQIHKGR